MRPEHVNSSDIVARFQPVVTAKAALLARFCSQGGVSAPSPCSARCAVLDSCNFNKAAAVCCSACSFTPAAQLTMETRSVLVTVACSSQARFKHSVSCHRQLFTGGGNGPASAGNRADSWCALMCMLIAHSYGQKCLQLQEPYKTCLCVRTLRVISVFGCGRCRYAGVSVCRQGDPWVVGAAPRGGGASPTSKRSQESRISRAITTLPMDMWMWCSVHGCMHSGSHVLRVAGCTCTQSDEAGAGFGAQ